LKTLLGFHFEVKFLSLSTLDLFSLVFWHCILALSTGDMVKVNQSMVKTVNIHQSKINVVKFDGTNNFDIWIGCADSIKPRTCSPFGEKAEGDLREGLEKVESDDVYHH